MRVKFDTIFEERDGELYFKQKTRIMGTSFSSGINAKGSPMINFDLFKEKDLEIQTDGDEIALKGIYN